MITDETARNNFNGTVNGIKSTFEQIHNIVGIDSSELLQHNIYGPLAKGLYRAAAEALLSREGRKLGPVFINGLQQNIDNQAEQEDTRSRYRTGMKTLVDTRVTQALTHMKDQYPTVSDTIVYTFLRSLTA